MKTKADFEDILAKVQFNDWAFFVGLDGPESAGRDTLGNLFPSGRLYLQVQANGTCNVNGEPWKWSGRKWFLSPHMTKSEVVQTAFKAVLTALEHEAREQFKYRGRSIYDPHYNVDLLWALRGADGALDVRDQ